MPRREIFLLTVKGERARPGLTAALTVSASIFSKSPPATPRAPPPPHVLCKCVGLFAGDNG